MPKVVHDGEGLRFSPGQEARGTHPATDGVTLSSMACEESCSCSMVEMGLGQR